MWIVPPTLLGLAAAYAVVLAACTFGFRRLQRRSDPVEAAHLPSVTVVIAARNEEDTIEACLSSILASRYPSDLLEIIVVDDHSTDSTADCVEHARSTSSAVTLVRLTEEDEGWGKRWAIERGVAHASGEIILLTDADCVVPSNWVASMVSSFRDHIRFVAGAVRYDRNGEWLLGLLELELMGLVTVGAGSIALGRPAMCNGASIAFRRSDFQEVEGYRGTGHVTSGDDGMLMLKMHRLHHGSVASCIQPDAVVTTRPPRNLGELVSQRRRWASKALQHGEVRVTAASVMVYGLNALLLVSSVVALVVGALPSWLLAAWGIKIAAEMWMFYHACSWFGRIPLLALVIPGQVLVVPYVVLTGALGMLGHYTWKDRRIRR